MTDKLKETVLQKVKKLLALAESDFEAEAESALLKAQELLLTHNLRIDDVNGLEEKEKVVDEKTIDSDTKNLAWYKKSIAIIIAKNMRCEIYMKRVCEGMRLNLIGLEEDVAIAKDMTEFTCRGVVSMWNKFKSENYSGTSKVKGITQIKNDYMQGFIDGLGEKFVKQVKEMALVVVKDALVTKKMRQKNTRKGSYSSGYKHSVNAEAYQTGKSDATFLGKNQFVGQNV